MLLRKRYRRSSVTLANLFTLLVIFAGTTTCLLLYWNLHDAAHSLQDAETMLEAQWLQEMRGSRTEIEAFLPAELTESKLSSGSLEDVQKSLQNEQLDKLFDVQDLAANFSSLLLSAYTEELLRFLRRQGSKLTENCKRKVGYDYLKTMEFRIMDPINYHFKSTCDRKGGFNLATHKRKTNYRCSHEVKLVYFIIFYQWPEHIIRMIERLRTGVDLFALAIDAQIESGPNTDVIEKMRKYAEQHSDVVVLPPMNTGWGGWSLVEVALEAMKYLQSYPDWEYFVWMSESDYILKPVHEIKEFFCKYFGLQITNAVPMKKASYDRMGNIYSECEDTLYHIGKRDLVQGRDTNGLTMYKGSQWAAFMRNFTEFVLTDHYVVDPFFKWFQLAGTSDEGYFASILSNSPFCLQQSTFPLQHYRFDLWQFRGPKFTSNCRPGVPFCGLGPMTLDEYDLPQLALTDALFARKVKPGVSDLLMKGLDEWLETKERPTSKLHTKKFLISHQGQCMVAWVQDWKPRWAWARCDRGDPNQHWMLTDCMGEIDMTTSCFRSEPFSVLPSGSTCRIRPVKENGFCFDTENFEPLQDNPVGLLGCRSTKVERQYFEFEKCAIKCSAKRCRKKYDNGLCVATNCKKYPFCFKECTERNAQDLTFQFLVIGEVEKVPTKEKPRTASGNPLERVNDVRRFGKGKIRYKFTDPIPYPGVGKIPRNSHPRPNPADAFSANFNSKPRPSIRSPVGASQKRDSWQQPFRDGSSAMRVSTLPSVIYDT